MNDQDLLRRAAAQFGIDPGYTDTRGRFHKPSEETLRGILSAAGVPAESAGDPPALDPTLVVREDAEFVLLRVPASRSGASVKVEAEWEGGELQHRWFWLPQLETVRDLTADGQAWIEKRLLLPAPLRLGYHVLRVYWMQAPELQVFAQAHFIVCPARVRVFEGRVAGVAISLYGLRSRRNWGCGDLTDLCAAIDSFARTGAQFIALNPLHALANRQPYNISPYLPQNSLYRNFLYLDVEKTPGYQADPALADGIAALRAADLVEYERVARLKLPALSAAFGRFLASGGSPAFDAYVETEGPPLHDYAVFCVLEEELHRQDPKVWIWTQWPPEYQDPRSAEVARFAEQHRTRVLFFKFLQWQLDRQLEAAQAHALACGMKIGLYHDLALATDRFGCDLWANRGLYVAGCRVGAPPDDFAPGGQDWGFPPPNRRAHRAEGYQRLALAIRKTARHGGALRFDHVMRFFRLYWIPDELPTSEGAYVRDFAEDLLGIIALESVRNGFIVVGEDLGTVAPEIRGRLAEQGILGCRLLWFEQDPDGSFRAPSDYPAQAAVSTTTHDLPTLAGFFAGRDIEARREAGLLDEDAYQEQWSARHRQIERLYQTLAETGFPGDALGFVLSTPCALAIVNQEDLTGETDQQNLPASTWQYPNWQRKMKVAVEDFAALEEDLRRRIQSSGR